MRLGKTVKAGGVFFFIFQFRFSHHRLLDIRVKSRVVLFGASEMRFFFLFAKLMKQNSNTKPFVTHAASLISLLALRYHFFSFIYYYFFHPSHCFISTICHIMMLRFTSETLQFVVLLLVANCNLLFLREMNDVL